MSVGIDVGTTTTQLVLSRLTVRNTRRYGLVPRLDVDSVQVLYVGEPRLTPLVSPEEIDVDALLAVLAGEYARASIEAAQVATGAVIITGETARSRNAESILAALAGLAGDFVVTVAGPRVESQIAGRGCGAAAWSAQRFTSVVTVDIGGGSANAALFRAGAHVDSAAAMVGGRQLQVDRDAGVVTHLGPSGRLLAETLGLDLEVGRRPSLSALRALADAMADIVVDLCLGAESRLGAPVALTEPLRLADPVTAYFVSGGVGLLYYDDAPADTLAQVAAHGDLGPLLARALRENERWRALPVQRPAQTLRATVLGAAGQHLTVSGSTIWIDDGVLPLRNLPVIEPQLDTGFARPQDVTQALRQAHRRWDEAGSEGSVALALRLPAGLDYRRLVVLATGIAAFAAEALAPGTPLVLGIDQDFAKVLGQSIAAQGVDVPLVVIDQLTLAESDVIDIGEPLLDGRVVPVSVKTLVFYPYEESTAGAECPESREPREPPVFPSHR